MNATVTTPTDEQVREKEHADAERLAKKIAKEATIYATIFDEVRKRLEPFAKWEEHKQTVAGVEHVVERVPPLLVGSDLKDVATTIYIQLGRGIAWSR